VSFAGNWLGGAYLLGSIAVEELITLQFPEIVRFSSRLIDLPHLARLLPSLMRTNGSRCLSFLVHSLLSYGISSSPYVVNENEVFVFNNTRRYAEMSCFRALPAEWYQYVRFCEPQANAPTCTVWSFFCLFSFPDGA
jgi:hypothetical protein